MTDYAAPVTDMRFVATRLAGRVTDFSGHRVRLASDEVLASNGLIHQDLISFFDDLFAGRNLSPIPTPQEFARARKDRK